MYSMTKLASSTARRRLAGARGGGVPCGGVRASSEPKAPAGPPSAGLHHHHAKSTGRERPDDSGGLICKWQKCRPPCAASQGLPGVAP